MKRTKSVVDEARLEQIAYDVSVLGDGIRIPGKPSLTSIIISTCARLPTEVYDELQISRILFVGPGPGQLGQALRLNLVGLPKKPSGDEPKSVFASTIRAVEIERNMIILSNELCDQSREDAMWTVAHELAHLHLGHVNPDSRNRGMGMEAEPEADRLAESWGFRRPHWKKGEDVSPRRAT